MWRKGVFGIALVMLASGGALDAAAAPPGGRSATYVESFEEGWGRWRPDHYIACEAAELPCPFNWSIERSTQQARHGRFSLRGFLDGRWDDGSIWVERPINVGRVREVTIELSFWLWSRGQSDVNTFPVLAFAERRNPATEADFAIVGQTDQMAGWQRYTYSHRFCSGRPGQAWVAFGFGATWETARTYFLDLAEVAVTQRRADSCAQQALPQA